MWEMVAKRNNNKIRNMPGFDNYGFFQIPLDFLPTLPCNFWRNSDNSISNDMDFTQFTSSSADIYVNHDTGNDTTGNGTNETPYKTLKKAVDVVVAAVAGTYKIIVTSDSLFYRDETIDLSNVLVDKILSIIPQNTTNKIIQTTAQQGLSWMAENNVWKTTRTSTAGVFDITTTDENGLYIPYTAVFSIALCKSTANSWYTDGSLVYVNTKNGSAPTMSDTLILVASGYPRFTLEGTSKLYLKNIHSYTGLTNGNGFAITGTIADGDGVGTVVCDGCVFCGGDLTTNVAALGNALSINNIKKTYMFNCIAANAKIDAFNYHADGVDASKKRGIFVLEYNCKAYNVGYQSTNTSTNCTTCHDGMSVIRFKSDGNGKYIPLADVNGCYSICIDCNMKNAVGTSGTYYFGYAIDTNGKAIVINCTDDGNSIGLNAEVKTFIHNHTGNIKNTGNQHIIN
jgi:hypothetical protein